LGSGYHLHSAEGGIVLLGGDPRYVLSQNGGLGAGSHLAMRLTVGALEQASSADNRNPASCITRIEACNTLAGNISPSSRKHHMIPSMKPTGEPLRQCQLRKFHEDAKAGEIYANKTTTSTFAGEHRRVHRGVLQSQRLHSALGYRPPEEFEQQTETESRSATMVFFENKESSKKNSKGLLGKETQMPSPSPDPFSC